VNRLPCGVRIRPQPISPRSMPWKNPADPLCSPPPPLVLLCGPRRRPKRPRAPSRPQKEPAKTVPAKPADDKKPEIPSPPRMRDKAYVLGYTMKFPSNGKDVNPRRLQGQGSF